MNLTSEQLTQLSDNPLNQITGIPVNCLMKQERRNLLLHLTGNGFSKSKKMVLMK